MSTKPTSSRSIVLAILAASALALGGCAETSGAGYGDGYVARAPIAGGASFTGASDPIVSTPAPQANTPVLRSNLTKPSTVKLARISDTR